jgi:hypothetical protein
MVNECVRPLTTATTHAVDNCDGFFACIINLKRIFFYRVALDKRASSFAEKPSWNVEGSVLLLLDGRGDGPFCDPGFASPLPLAGVGDLNCLKLEARGDQIHVFTNIDAWSRFFSLFLTGQAII